MEDALRGGETGEALGALLCGLERSLAELLAVLDAQSSSQMPGSGLPLSRQ